MLSFKSSWRHGVGSKSGEPSWLRWRVPFTAVIDDKNPALPIIRNLA